MQIGAIRYIDAKCNLVIQNNLLEEQLQRQGGDVDVNKYGPVRVFWDLSNEARQT